MTPTHGTGPGPKTRGMATTGKSLRSRPRQWGEREGVKAETPVERAAEALRSHTLARHGRTESRMTTPSDYEPTVRAVFASIDVVALARAIAREDGWIGELAQAHTYHGGLYLRRARAVLAYLTGGTE